MQRFRFRLQRVLDLWEKQADAEQLRLQSLHAERAALEEQQQQLGRQRRDAEQQVVQCPSVTAAELMSLESFRRFAAQQRRQIAARQAQCAVLIERQLAVVMEARRRTRLLEKFRENQQAEWKREFDRELEQLAAESYLSGVIRRRIQSP
ncbi:MAG: hypothetical protein IT160_11695 [Bryobacterales bacterium]|nr:hypothetical protein [Bryobacterales bacterium]